MNFKIASIVVIAVLLLQSCKKDDDQTGINFNASTSGRSSIVSRPSGTLGTLTWTSGFAYVTEVEFEAEKDNREIEFKSTVNKRIDLFVPFSSLGFVSVAPGFYEEVEFEIDLNSDANNPSIELRGTYDNTPVILRIMNSIEFEAEYEDVTIEMSDNFTANFALNLSLLTVGITDAALRNATRSNGDIVISPNSNVALYNTIISNLNNIDSVELDD
jgi:hypothetical protein